MTFALSFAGSFPLWLHLSQRIGKRKAMLSGLLLGCVVPLGWMIVQPGQRVAMLVFMVLAGVVTGSLTLVMSSAVDVVDFDELETGERREGAYFGIWTLGLKAMSACGILLSGALLQFVGYVPDRPQDPTDDVVAGDDSRAAAGSGTPGRVADVSALPFRSGGRGAGAGSAAGAARA